MAATVPLTYQWTAAGVDVVEQAFTRIDKAAERSAQKAVAEAAKAAKAKTAAAAKAAREAEQGAAKEAAAAAKAAAAETTAANKAAAAQAKARERVFQIRAKYEAQEAKLAERAAAQSAKAQERALKHVADVRSRYFLQQQREEEKAARAGQRTRGMGIGSIFGGAATTAVALGVGTVGAAAREEFALRGAANRISIAGARPGQEQVASGDIVSAIHGAAAATPGVDKTQLAAGLHEMVKLGGDTAGAVEHLKTMATTMQALGIGGEDTAKIMVALKESFGVTGVKDMQDAIAKLESQAKAAGVPMEDLGSHIMTMAASGKRFGFTGAQGAQQIGGLMSMARQGIGDPEKAEKAAAHFLEKLQEQGGKLAAMGVTTVSKDGKQMKPLNEIVAGLITKVGGNNMRLKGEELTKLLGSGERGGAGVIGAPLATYTRTFNETQGTQAEKQKAATAAMTVELERLTSSAATWKDVQENAARAEEGTGVQLSAAWEKISAEVGGDVAPVLAKLASHAGEAADILLELGKDAGLGDVFDVLKTDLEAFGDAIKEVHTLLGIKEKPQDPFKAFSKAQKELGRFEKEHTGLWNTEGEAVERTRLTTNLETARNTLYQPTRHLMALGEGNFADEYAAASGAEKGSFKYGAQRDVGMRLAKQIHADPSANLITPEAQKMGFYNDKQKQLISGLQDEEGASKAKVAFEAHAAAAKQSEAALSNMTAAANDFTTALGGAAGAADRNKPLSDRN